VTRSPTIRWRRWRREREQPPPRWPRAHLRHSIEAAELERRRWARELHDETLQGLGALDVLLNSGLTGDRDAVIRQSLGYIEEQIASLRALISDLRPAVLDEVGLQPALEALAE
jgi:signal transduction histidine kinase